MATPTCSSAGRWVDDCLGLGQCRQCPLAGSVACGWLRLHVACMMGGSTAGSTQAVCQSQRDEADTLSTPIPDHLYAQGLVSWAAYTYAGDLPSLAYGMNSRGFAYTLVSRLQGSHPPQGPAPSQGSLTRAAGVVYHQPSGARVL